MSYSPKTKQFLYLQDNHLHLLFLSQSKFLSPLFLNHSLPYCILLAYHLKSCWIPLIINKINKNDNFYIQNNHISLFFEWLFILNIYKRFIFRTLYFFADKGLGKLSSVSSRWIASQNYSYIYMYVNKENKIMPNKIKYICYWKF